MTITQFKEELKLGKLYCTGGETLVNRKSGGLANDRHGEYAMVKSMYNCQEIKTVSTHNSETSVFGGVAIETTYTEYAMKPNDETKKASFIITSYYCYGLGFEYTDESQKPKKIIWVPNVGWVSSKKARLLSKLNR